MRKKERKRGREKREADRRVERAACAGYSLCRGRASSSIRAAVGLGGKSWTKLEGEVEKEAHRIYTEERVARFARARGRNRNERRQMGGGRGDWISGKKREVRWRRAVGNTSSGCYW